ncbi:MAG: CrcB family protein [Aphanocapsa feldmannii 277cV]|uniref:Fluoride-specific ion channel FluC n=1 Tax=Aphanocapsa feldmannii 277cV TaxID=2507553 RepID=A0A524RPW4_9CHRO|nr:MAG: CrcB family protein [Aphanocapsa feldmannii 288cV]TGG94406.1 MAG: CrcB family protein [Aphanocapsa feldmannii 277cV]
MWLDLRELLLVAAGSVPGALLRWWAATALGSTAAWGSAASDLLVNLFGSLLLGILVGAPACKGGPYLLLGVGFCGSLTTFSSWMLALHRFEQQGKPLDGLLLLCLSVGLGVAAAGCGLVLGRRTVPRR